MGVIVKQARPMLAPLLLRFVRYMRNTASHLYAGGERVARSRDMALFVTAFHTMQRGFDLACALAAQVLHLPDGTGMS